LVLLVLVIIGYIVIDKARCNRRTRDVILLDQGASAMGDAVVLEEIRENRLSNALELLELSLDTELAVFPITTNNDVDVNTREMLLHQLVVIQKYREKHPRRVEATIK
jgi:hypothetical protein